MGTPRAHVGGKPPSVGWENAARVADRGPGSVGGLSSVSSRLRVERGARSGPESAHLSSLLVRCDASRGNSTAALADEQWTPPPKGRHSCGLATPCSGATPPGPLAFPHLSAIQDRLAGRPLRALQGSVSSVPTGSARVWPRVEAHLKHQSITPRRHPWATDPSLCSAQPPLRAEQSCLHVDRATALAFSFPSEGGGERRDW